MKEKPLISVIVPCHNAQAFIQNCLDSLDKQTYANTEFILVDDGSTDNTKNIIENHIKDKPKYQLIVSENVGVSTARNLGIERSIGDFITFMDSDDMISPYHIELMCKFTLETGADSAVIDYLKVPEGKAYSEYKFQVPYGQTCETEEFDNLGALEEFLGQKKFEFCVWNKLYSGDIIRQQNVRFLDGCKYNEDSLFNYKFFKHSKKTVLIHWLTYLYVQRKGSLVHAPFNEYKLDAFYSLNNIVKDAYETRPDIIHYAHIMRVALSCEIIYYIKFTKNYKNGAVIKKIIEYIKTDAKHLKYCKRTHRYRRVLIPLVPAVAKLLLCRRRKLDGTLPPQFEITDK